LIEKQQKDRQALLKEGISNAVGNMPIPFGITFPIVGERRHDLLKPGRSALLVPVEQNASVCNEIE
jgi:hypothetical protein